MMNQNYRVNFDGLEWITPGDDIRYKCYESGGQKVRLVEFGKKMVHSNWCIKGHLGYVIEGQLELTFFDKTEVYQAGDAIFIPNGEAHKHRPKVLSDKVIFFSVETA